MMNPMITKEVRNCSSAIDIYVFETLSDAAQAAVNVPDPGKIKLRKADTKATGLVTFGTLVTCSHTYLSESSKTATLFFI